MILFLGDYHKNWLQKTVKVFSSTSDWTSISLEYNKINKVYKKKTKMGKTGNSSFMSHKASSYTAYFSDFFVYNVSMIPENAIFSDFYGIASLSLDQKDMRIIIAISSQDEMCVNEAM